MEEFRDIPGYSDYQVSNLGRVKSLKYSKEKIKKLRIDAYGYYYINLYINSKTKLFKIHTLVAMTFLNHTPNGKNDIVVDHINNDRLDNRLENLQLTTTRHNTSKDKKNKTSKYTGVCLDKRNGRWITHIRIDSKKKWLGSFHNEEEAHNAYQTALNNL